MAVADLRPRTVTEIVDAAVRLMASHYLMFVMLGALISLPALIFGQLMFDAMGGGVPGRIQWIPLLEVTGVGFLVAAMNEAISSSAMSDVYLGGPLDVANAISRTLPRLFAVVVATILRWALVALGLLLIVPGIYIGVRTACLPATLVLDEQARGPFAGFARNWRLAEDAETRIFLSFLLLTVLYAIAYAVSWSITKGLAAAVPALHGQRIATLVQQSVNLFAAPAGPAVTTVLYYDLRVRKEGFDVEMMSRALELAPAR